MYGSKELKRASQSPSLYKKQESKYKADLAGPPVYSSKPPNLQQRYLGNAYFEIQPRYLQETDVYRSQQFPAGNPIPLRLRRMYGNHHVQRVLGPASQADGETEVAPEIEQTIRRARSGGRGIDSKVRVPMESAFGFDFNGVRVHTDSQADQLNRSLNAQAFTTGRDIFFRRNSYRPDSPSGRKLLAHELAHVIQQGYHPRAQHNLTLGRSTDRYEQEAHRVAHTITQQQHKVVPGSGSGKIISHHLVNLRTPNLLVQRNGDNEQQSEMVFSLAEATWGWERVHQGFQRHRQEIRSKVENEFTRYAIRAKEGAQAGVSEIFQPYEEDLIWAGVDTTAVTSLLGLVPKIGSVISAAVGTIMAHEMARRNIQINRLKGSISSRLEDEINAQLIDEDTPEREQLMRDFERQAARKYLEILNDPDRNIVPDSDEMKDELVNHVNAEIVISSKVKDEWQSYVKRAYGPIVERALREPEPRECPSCHDILRQSEEAARRRRMRELFRSTESLFQRERGQLSPQEMEALRLWIEAR